MQKVDWDKPIEIAEDIFWVGAKIPEDKFQCHVYLLRCKDDSVLFDPGSLLTFKKTIDKIKELINPNQVRYFVCHHQDPDITACISSYEDLYPRKDRFIVTHWRTQALLKHYAWKSKFYEVTEHDWQLRIGDGRIIKFIFTPYAHFSGSICSYDEKTKVLFSSDIFGGFVSKDTIFAEDISYFDDIRLFHEHYIPSNEILRHSLKQFEKLELNLIAPQHGYLIPKRLIPDFLKLLSNLECGLFKFSYETRDIVFLDRIRNFFQRLITEIVKNPSFREILEEIYKALKELFNVEEFFIIASEESELLLYSPISDVRFQILDENPKRRFKELLKDLPGYPSLIFIEPKRKDILSSPYYISLPLALPRKNFGIAFLGFKENPEEFLRISKNFLEEFEKILITFLSKELEITIAEKEKEKFYNYAVKDPLTGVYNRFYLNLYIRESMPNLLRYHVPFSVIILDIDYFKKVNDTYGHLVGDQVLKQLAEILTKGLRKGDIVIRYGGEEFLILLPYTRLEEASQAAERLRKNIESTEFFIDGNHLKITISLGVASLSPKIKKLEELIKIADQKLYKAKNTGRNRVVF